MPFSTGVRNFSTQVRRAFNWGTQFFNAGTQKFYRGTHGSTEVRSSVTADHKVRLRGFLSENPKKPDSTGFKNPEFILEALKPPKIQREVSRHPFKNGSFQRKYAPLHLEYAVFQLEYAVFHLEYAVIQYNYAPF